MEKSSKVAWGTIVAGAAIVAGAVLFCPTLMDKIPGIGESIVEGAKNLGSTIADAIRSLFTTTAPATPSTPIDWAAWGATAKKVAGAALIGGGAAYLMSSGGEDPHAHHRSEAQQSFALREDLRKMQARQMVMAAAAGHPQAIAMMQQGGRV